MPWNWLGRSAMRPFPTGPLPNTLAELVAARLGGLAAGLDEALLAIACVPAPTIDLVARATGSDGDRVAQMLGTAEDKGIVAVDGQGIRFTHPLLSQGVYTLATPARRRAMHRRLAATVDQPELRARHLALAATSGDAATMNSLDAAAESARSRERPPPPPSSSTWPSDSVGIPRDGGSGRRVTISATVTRSGRGRCSRTSSP